MPKWATPPPINTTCNSRAVCNCATSFLSAPGYVAQPDAEANALPVYAAGRFLLPLATGLKPYVDARLGYAFPLGGEQVSGGAFFGLTTGVELNHWMFGMGYQGVWLHRDAVSERSRLPVREGLDTQGFTLRLGYRF